MSDRGEDKTAEQRESLWIITISPAIWSAHFLACYLTASIWCAKFAGPDGLLGGVPTAIGIYTAVALGGIGTTAWIGYRRHRHERASLPHDEDSPEDRYRFLGFATLLLSGLSAVATAWVGLVAVFFRSCV